MKAFPWDRLQLLKMQLSGGLTGQAGLS